jgi:choline-glycine betaine transporter
LSQNDVQKTNDQKVEDMERASSILHATSVLIAIVFYFISTVARVFVTGMIEEIYNFDVPNWINIAGGGVTGFFCFGLYLILKHQITSLKHASYIAGQSNPK